MNLLKLTDSNNETTVYVVSDKIVAVKRVDVGTLDEETRVYVGNDNYFGVIEPIDVIVAELTKL